MATNLEGQENSNIVILEVMCEYVYRTHYFYNSPTSNLFFLRSNIINKEKDRRTKRLL